MSGIVDTPSVEYASLFNDACRAVTSPTRRACDTVSFVPAFFVVRSPASFRDIADDGTSLFGCSSGNIPDRFKQNFYRCAGSPPSARPRPSFARLSGALAVLVAGHAWFFVWLLALSRVLSWFA